jgi:hypothetical protein
MNVDHFRFGSRFLDPRPNDIHNFVAEPLPFPEHPPTLQITACFVCEYNIFSLVHSKRAVLKIFTRQGRLTAATRFLLHQRMVDEICACY